MGDRAAALLDPIAACSAAECEIIGAGGWVKRDAKGNRKGSNEGAKAKKLTAAEAKAQKLTAALDDACAKAKRWTKTLLRVKMTVARLQKWKRISAQAHRDMETANTKILTVLNVAAAQAPKDMKDMETAQDAQQAASSTTAGCQHDSGPQALKDAQDMPPAW